MRKLDLEALAQALDYTRPERLSVDSCSPDADKWREQYRLCMAQWVRDVKAAARAAAERNGPGFSYPRFYSMCGLTEENDRD